MKNPNAGKKNAGNEKMQKKCRMTSMGCALLAAVLVMGGCGAQPGDADDQVSWAEELKQEAEEVTESGTAVSNSGTGDRETGKGNKMDPEPGKSSTGNPETGKGNTGDLGPGSNNTGNLEPGKSNTGETDGNGKVVAGSNGYSTGGTKGKSGAEKNGPESGSKGNAKPGTENAAGNRTSSGEAEADNNTSAEQGSNSVGSPSDAHISCVWDNGKITREASCSAEGQKVFTCTVCGAEKTESISMSGHRYITETMEPTCTEAGRVKSYCQDCGKVQSETQGGAATGHSMTTQWFGEPPTCTRGGHQTVLCSKCGWVDADACGTVPPLEHENVGTELQHGNCMDYTVIEYTCSRCGEQTGFDRHNEPDEHQWVWKEDSIWDDAAGGFVTIRVECCERCNARP